jgi:hypothetical protein
MPTNTLTQQKQNPVVADYNMDNLSKHTNKLNFLKEFTNKIICGDALETMRQMK